jgi:hypothetical protein
MVPRLELSNGSSQSLSPSEPPTVLTFFRPLLNIFVAMFSKSSSALIFLLALTSSVNAQAVITPELGVKGTPASADVKTPSLPGHPCGINVDVATNIDTSNVVEVDTNGILFVDIVNFAV